MSAGVTCGLAKRLPSRAGVNSWVLKVPAILILSFSLAASAWGQRVEGRVAAGVSSFADDSDVNYLTVGGDVRSYVSNRWRVEAEYLYMRYQGEFVRDRQHILWGNVGYDVRYRSHSVRPYWIASPGIVHHRSSFNQFSNATTEAAIATGAGVRLGSGRFFVTPQFRFGLADGIFAEFTASIGFVMRK